MKSENKTLIFFLVFLLFLTSIGILKINGFSVLGINFSPNNLESKNNPVVSSSNNIKDIEIKEFYPELEIFSANTDNATVRFLVENGLHIPYNITVEYYYGETYVNRWFNLSTEIYNETKTDNPYYSFIPVLNSIGNWSAQLYIDYFYQDNSFRKSKTINFKVADKTSIPTKTTFYSNGSIIQDY